LCACVILFSYSFLSYLTHTWGNGLAASPLAYLYRYAWWSVLYDEEQQQLATVASSIRYKEEGCCCRLREGLRNPSPINQSNIDQYLEYN